MGTSRRTRRWPASTAKATSLRGRRGSLKQGCSRRTAHPDPGPRLTLARRSQAEKLHKLNEIRAQLQETSTSVRQGKQLLGSLAENYGSTPSLQ